MIEKRHGIVKQGTARLHPVKGDRERMVQTLECRCGWVGETHVWAWHLETETAR